ncbi:MAG: hypothetical protein NVSMB47_11100 [Polyangiales bacterium]
MNLAHLLDWIPFGAVPELTAAELVWAVEHGRDGVQLLDVRSRGEFDRGHLAGARHAPLTAFTRALEGLDLDPRRRVVAICASGHRSIPAVRILRRRGFVAAVQLAGGMRAWRAAGLPVVR